MNKLTKRIIPCLDIKDGTTVKGVKFNNLQDLGDPVELAKYYAEQGADELVLLDITATHEQRKQMTTLVTSVARTINIPFTVGGGITSVQDVYKLLLAGADKISINSAAVRDPVLIEEIALQFGTQCVVVAVDTSFINGDWYVFLNGGRIATKLRAADWIREAADKGAGELLITSMDHDGTGRGFANELIANLSSLVNIPVIASGGAGTQEHFSSVFLEGKADAALAAGIFHRKELMIPALKQFLKTQNIAIR